MFKNISIGILRDKYSNATIASILHNSKNDVYSRDIDEDDGDFDDGNFWEEGDIICDIVKNPFNNCQIYSIGGVDELFYYSQSDKEFMDYIMLSYHFARKNILLIDINTVDDNLVDFIENNFNIRDTKEYVSTSSSNMKMYFINISPMYIEFSKKLTANQRESILKLFK